MSSGPYQVQTLVSLHPKVYKADLKQILCNLLYQFDIGRGGVSGEDFGHFSRRNVVSFSPHPTPRIGG